MSPDDALDHVRRNSHTVLCTVRRDGTPQMSPVLAGVDDDGLVVVSARARSAKVANLRRDPRAWLCVLSDRFFGDWVQLGVWAEVVDLPDALDPLVELYRTLSGEHPHWDAYRDAMVEEDRVLLRMEVDTAGPG